MAEEQDDSQKTEEPTQKRLDDAREKGQVAVSREVNHWFMIVASLIVLLMLGPAMARDVSQLLLRFVELPHLIATDGGSLQQWGAAVVLDLGLVLLPALGLLVVAALGAGFAQAGVLFAPDSIMPKLERLSPLKGLKRMISLKSIAEFVKGLLKIAIVGAVATMVLLPELSGPEPLVGADPAELLATIARLTLKLFGAVLAVMTVIAGIDLLYQKISHRQQLRMSRQELRDEMKQSEGDPIVKGRLRQIRVERARRRMMQEVPKADVVITNPTHFAVALRYDQTSMAAPRVVAKGADNVALRIREIAAEHHVPIVENPPLARALFTVDLDVEIPPDHYKAVAEIISFVMRARRGGGNARP